MVLYSTECKVIRHLTKDISEQRVPKSIFGNNKPKRNRKTKSVHFADTKGLALASIFHFAKENSEPSRTRRRIDVYKRNDHGNPATLLNFKSCLPYREILECLPTRNVCLQNIVCNKFGICGLIYVKNLAFEKEVFVRFTFDAWQSSNDQHASYIPGTSTGETDAFFFQIKPPQTSENRKMQFAICYKVGNDEFWDNNHGDDYRLVYWKTDIANVAINNEE